MSFSNNISGFSGNSFGMLYLGSETAKERFNVGDRVKVGASYSEKMGTIVDMSDEFPFKAQVELKHANGGSTICWIKTMHLANIAKEKPGPLNRQGL